MGNGWWEGSSKGLLIQFDVEVPVYKVKCTWAAQPSGRMGHMKGIGSICELLAWLCNIPHRSSSRSLCPVASQEKKVKGWKQSYLWEPMISLSVREEQTPTFYLWDAKVTSQQIGPCTCNLSIGHILLPECLGRAAIICAPTLMTGYLV